MGVLEGEGIGWFDMVLVGFIIIFILGGFVLLFAASSAQASYCRELGFDGSRMGREPSHCFKITDDGELEKRYFKKNSFGFPIRGGE